MTSLYKDVSASRCEAASQNTAVFIAELPCTLLAQIKSAFVLLTVWQQRYEMRRHLRTLDDRLLADMGMSEVARRLEASKPFWKE
jgi:uncharacterized protein YjiS (DUF1127 family)